VFSYLEERRRLPREYSLRPFNRFNQDFSDWWIIPSKAWPAYPHGKLFVSPVEPAPDPPERMYCGYYLEKGLGQALAGQAGVRRPLLLQADWYWHDFINLACAGKVDASLRQAVEASPTGLRVRVDAYEFNRVAEPDGERQRPHDKVRFAVTLPDLAFAVIQPARDILKPLNSCKNLRELAGQLPRVPGLEFFWVDLLIGVCLDYGGSPPDAWGAEQLWRGCFEPWWLWVK
jgi:hypothetical protein